MSHQRGVRVSDDDGESIRLCLLGGFALEVDGQEVSLPPNSQRLLAYLALRRRWSERQIAAAALWPTTEPRRASANLRSVLWRITREVGRVIVTADAYHLGLTEEVGIDFVDVERDTRRCADPRGSGPSGPATVRVDDLSIDLLPGWPEEWIEVHRECFRQFRLRALERLCDQHRHGGRLRQAMDLALAAVSAEPLRESAHRQLVMVHLAEGNVAEAVRQYDLYRRVLRCELGLVPSPVMRGLVAPLLACPARSE